MSAKYPTPHIDGVLMKVCNSKIFSVIHLQSAYHQILIDKEYREKTACVTQDYKCQWIRMPFGLSRAAYTLAAAINFHTFQPPSGSKREVCNKPITPQRWHHIC